MLFIVAGLPAIASDDDEKDSSAVLLAAVEEEAAEDEDEFCRFNKAAARAACSFAAIIA